MTFVQSTINTPQFTFESLLMAVITSSILLIAISICLVSKKIMVNVGYKLLAVFLFFTLLRFLFPLELPVSVSICIPDILATPMAIISHVFFYIISVPVSIWSLCIIICLLGSLIQLVRYIISCNKSRRYLILNGKDITDNVVYHSMLDRICSERHKSNTFRIIEIEHINTPMIYGIFRPCILFPSDINLSENNLYYALSHEAAHHFHHDLLIKAGINILAIVYWWNPAVYVLKKQANLLLEMRVDSYITHKDDNAIKEYLHCLINISEYAIDKNFISENLTLSFYKGSATDLEKRFYMLCNADKQRITILNFLIMVIILIIYLLSYRYIIEPYCYPTEVNVIDDDDRIEYYLPLDNTYVIENADGTYSVYLDTEDMPDFFLETFDTLDNLTQGIPVYYLEKYNYK
jgi:beta-lactamase regulating signal transducer with metallopeptidase domain